MPDHTRDPRLDLEAALAPVARVQSIAMAEAFASGMRDYQSDRVLGCEARPRPAGSLSMSDLDGLGGTIGESDPGNCPALQVYDEVRVAPVGPRVRVGLGVKCNALQIALDVAA